MTNARYHTFRLQNLFVSCPNIFIKQPYSIFFLVWSAVPIIYILSPSPFIFVSVFLLRQEKKLRKESKIESLCTSEFWILAFCVDKCCSCYNFSSSKTIRLFCHALFSCGTHIYIVQCAICIERREKILQVFRRNDYKENSLQWKLIFWDVSIICNKEGILFWWKHIVEGHCLSQNRTKEGPTRCVAVLNILFIASNLIFLHLYSPLLFNQHGGHNLVVHLCHKKTKEKEKEKIFRCSTSHNSLRGIHPVHPLNSTTICSCSGSYICTYFLCFNFAEPLPLKGMQPTLLADYN